MQYLAIDPSAKRSCGWCLHDSITQEFEWGTFEMEGLNYKSRLVGLVHSLGKLLDDNHFDFEAESFRMVAEWPCFYQSTAGHIAAVQGFTIDLAGVVMFVAGWFRLPARKLTLYTAPMWKGSVPKQVTARKFFKTFGHNPDRISQDAIDATMMLVHHIQQPQP